MYNSECNITLFTSENRYLLFLTENYAALDILKHYLGVEGVNNSDLTSQPYILFGSSFPKDKEYTQVSEWVSEWVNAWRLSKIKEEKGIGNNGRDWIQAHYDDVHVQWDIAREIGANKRGCSGIVVTMYHAEQQEHWISSVKLSTDAAGK